MVLLLQASLHNTSATRTIALTLGAATTPRATCDRRSDQPKAYPLCGFALAGAWGCPPDSYFPPSRERRGTKGDGLTAANQPAQYVSDARTVALTFGAATTPRATSRSLPRPAQSIPAARVCFGGETGGVHQIPWSSFQRRKGDQGGWFDCRKPTRANTSATRTVALTLDAAITPRARSRSRRRSLPASPPG